MKVAIAGAGIAGGYLARLLEQNDIHPDLYDCIDHRTACKCRSCGWGAPTDIRRYLSSVDLDLADYLMNTMGDVNFDGIVAKTPLCTINKPRLLQDLTWGQKVQDHHILPGEMDTYDVLVDATGIARALLPPCKSDLTLPTLQYRVSAESRNGDRLEAGVYGEQIPGLGYVWVFPLAKNQFHIGVGGIGLERKEDILERFFSEMTDRFVFTPLCSCCGVVRVASPYYSTPFYSYRHRSDGTVQPVIGVGESIGTVSPFTGEGIVYSLQCAKILSDLWPDEKAYASKVLSTFGWMKKERETIDYLLFEGRKTGPRLRDRWRFFRNAQRSQIGLPIIEAFRRMGSLSSWLEE
jgi:flavin-dependent dehydrogenase